MRSTRPHRNFVVAGIDVLFLAVSVLCFPVSAPAQSPPVSAVLIQNVRIFDGKSATLSGKSNVLVTGNKIEKISTAAIPVQPGPGITIIDGAGRVLMPGLIDAHWHAFMAATPQPLLMTADSSYLTLLAAQEAEATLMRGFTTVRDLGGPVFGLKRAIDEGVTIGPRIYPSGAMISQTSGHGDFRLAFELPRTLGGPLSHSEVEGISAIADSPDEVRLRAREQLRQGASQIKLMASGGVNSQYSHLEATEYTEAEIHAAVRSRPQGVDLPGPYQSSQSPYLQHARTLAGACIARRSQSREAAGNRALCKPVSVEYCWRNGSAGISPACRHASDSAQFIHRPQPF
jgi:Amidohydrolase family